MRPEAEPGRGLATKSDQQLPQTDRSLKGPDRYVGIPTYREIFRETFKVLQRKAGLRTKKAPGKLPSVELQPEDIKNPDNGESGDSRKPRLRLLQGGEETEAAISQNVMTLTETEKERLSSLAPVRNDPKSLAELVEVSRALRILSEDPATAGFFDGFEFPLGWYPIKFADGTFRGLKPGGFGFYEGPVSVLEIYNLLREGRKTVQQFLNEIDPGKTEDLEVDGLSDTQKGEIFGYGEIVNASRFRFQEEPFLLKLKEHFTFVMNKILDEASNADTGANIPNSLSEVSDLSVETGIEYDQEKYLQAERHYHSLERDALREEYLADSEIHPIRAGEAAVAVIEHLDYFGEDTEEAKEIASKGFKALKKVIKREFKLFSKTPRFFLYVREAQTLDYRLKKYEPLFKTQKIRRRMFRKAHLKQRIKNFLNFPFNR